MAQIAFANKTQTAAYDATKINAQDINDLKNSANAADLASLSYVGEISRTASAPLTAADMRTSQVLSGSTALTLTLPPVSSALYGQRIAVRVDAASPVMHTVAAGGSSTIDGQPTRLLQKGESAILVCLASGWSKVGGRTVPLSAKVSLVADSTFAPATAGIGIVSLPLTRIIYDNSPGMATGGKLTLLRPGSYQISANLRVVQPGTNPATYAELLARLGGVQDANTVDAPLYIIPGTANAFLQLGGSVSATAGQVLDLGIYADQNVSVWTGSAAPQHIATLSVAEVLSW